MKKKLFLIIFISVIIIPVAIVIYNINSNIEFTKVNLKNTDKKVKTFINQVNNKNGIYLYQNNNKSLVFLNGSNVDSGEKSLYFTDIKMEVKANTLIINFNEKYTDDYKNNEIDHSVLYRIKNFKSFYTIKIYKNGEETHFDLITN